MIITILLSVALSGDTCKTPITGAQLMPTIKNRNYIAKGKMYFTGIGWDAKQERALFLLDSCMLKSAYRNYTRWVNRTQK